MAPSPLIIRQVGGAILIICSVVVLAISIHVENSSRALGFKTSTFTYDAFVGAFTTLVELVALVTRTQLVNFVGSSFAVEIGLTALLWIFWLASGIRTTTYTEESRSFCKNLDDLFDLPELKDLDAAQLAAAKKILQSACSEIHAQLAFVWIGFVVLTFVTAYLLWLGVRQQSRGNRSIWRTSVHNYNVSVHSHSDPFNDPIGGYPGPSVGVAGVVDEESNPDRKP
ncbi:hypothetical protein P7C73_g1069, partial [Tremellales sp. Uapishka_1]